MVLPVYGITCDGTAFMQFGDKMGGGAMAPGMKSMFEFGMNQVMQMQQCRANKENGKYKFSRPDFLNHFAIYTPLAWISAFTKPPVSLQPTFIDLKRSSKYRHLNCVS